MPLLFCKANFCYYNLYYLSFISRQQLLVGFLWDVDPFFMVICPQFCDFLEVTTYWKSQHTFSIGLNQGTANATPGCSKTSVGAGLLLILLVLGVIVRLKCPNDVQASASSGIAQHYLAKCPDILMNPLCLLCAEVSLYLRRQKPFKHYQTYSILYEG